MFWLPGLCCKTPMYPGSSLTSSEQFLRAIWEAATWAWSPQKVCQIKQFSTFRLWIFFQLTKIRIQFHSFSCRYPDFPSTICWRDYPFPILFSWKFCWRLVYHIHLDLFLGSILFHWSPCLSLCQCHTVLIAAANKQFLTGFLPRAKSRGSRHKCPSSNLSLKEIYLQTLKAAAWGSSFQIACI